MVECLCAHEERQLAEEEQQNHPDGGQRDWTAEQRAEAEAAHRQRRWSDGAAAWARVRA